jgi:hypothetical protein
MDDGGVYVKFWLSKPHMMFIKPFPNLDIVNCIVNVTRINLFFFTFSKVQRCNKTTLPKTCMAM